jgi:metal-responsive CopG/Arc/MetJ family transcriptional regulator
MRTTIEIPHSLRQKLVSEAASRRKKGFSSIIIEALESYFNSSLQENRMKSIRALKGCMTNSEVEEELKRISEERKNWTRRF